MFKKLILLLALALGIQGGVSTTVSAQERMTNEQARTIRKIRKELLTLPYYGVFDFLSFKLEGDKVTLSGYVVRPITKSDAEEAVKDVDGVANVVNNIEVLPLSPSDDRIRVRAYNTIARQSGLYRYFLGANPSIHIIVKNGRITLEGYVANEGDSNLVNITARGISGTFGVENNLIVERTERRN